MHVIRLLVILSVLKSLASQLSLRKEIIYKIILQKKIIDLMVVYIDTYYM